MKKTIEYVEGPVPGNYHPKSWSEPPVRVQRVVRHPAYVLTVILVVMPMIGAIMERGQVWLGIALIAMQAPWAMQRAYEIWKGKDA